MIIIICSLLVILLVSCKKQESPKDVQTSTPDTTNEFADIDNDNIKEPPEDIQTSTRDTTNEFTAMDNDNIKEPPGDIQTSTPDSLNGPAAKNKDNTLKGDIPNKYKNAKVVYKSTQEKMLKRSYYSPDGKECIEERSDGVVDEVNSYDCFLYSCNNNILIDEFGRVNLNQVYYSPINWINNDEAIIKGEYIYNIKSNTKVKNLLDSRMENMKIINFSLNDKKDKIAYLFSSWKYSGDEDDFGSDLELYILDLKDNSFNLAYHYDTILTYFNDLNIIWCNDDIYFEVYDLGIDRVGDIYGIMKYDTKTKECVQIAKEGQILGCSYY